MLNTSIESRDSFNQLVVNIVKELSSITQEIKELNKVEQIKSKLVEMYKSVKDEACSTLKRIQENFKQHEEDFKQKLCEYVGNIRENLKTLAKEPKPMIGGLRTKIEALVGRKNGCGNRTGKLVELQNKIREANTKFDSYGTVNFMKTGDPLGHDNFRKVLKVEEKVRQFTGLAFEYLQSIYKTQRKLCNIIVTLNEKTEFDRIIKEIEGLSNENINTYETKIIGHKSKLHLLNPLSLQIEPYRKSLGGTRGTNGLPDGLKGVTKAVKELKQCVQENKQYLDGGFVTEVTEITKIEDTELDDIRKGIQEIMEFVNLIQKYIDNTRLFFGYLNVFKEHKSRIDALQIEGNSISDIQNTIKSLEDVISTITEAQTPIHQDKQKLEKEYKPTWGSDKQHEDAMRGIKSLYFPKDLRVFDDLRPFDGHLEKLKAIKSFNTVLEEMDPGTILDLLDSGEEATIDIDGLLIRLSLIDGILSITGKLMESHFQKIESSHESNKSNLNSTQNRNVIRTNVDQIKKIPGKLSQLHNTVRIYIQLTQTVSRVIETLDKMKPKALDLIGIKDTVGNLRKNVESSISELKFFDFEARHLIYINHITNILTFGRYIHKLKGHLEKLNVTTSSIKKIEINLNISISELKDYQKILGEIYLEMEKKRSRLIAFYFPTQFRGRKHMAYSASITGEVFSSLDKIIQDLKCILRETSQLTTIISQVHYSICCTKRKIGCFVGSLETKGQVDW